jgi:hypothetical protein
MQSEFIESFFHGTSRPEVKTHAMSAVAEAQTPGVRLMENVAGGD